MARPDDHLAGLVREADPDRYLSALYAPDERRPALLALYAFNAEAASVRDRVSEPMPGEIRLQWWRDVVAASEGQPAAGNPLAEELVAAIGAYRLSRAALDNYLEARIFDLYNDPMPSRTDLEGYCGETASTIIQLAAFVLDADAAPRHAALAGHAGCAQAIAGLLRLLPIHRARGQCYVPRDILDAAGLTADVFVSSEAPRDAAVTAVEAMAALGREHQRAFETEARSLPSSLRPAYLPAGLAGAYLSAVAASPEKALTRPAGISALRRHYLLFRCASRGWRAGRKGDR